MAIEINRILREIKDEYAPMKIDHAFLHDICMTTATRIFKKLDQKFIITGNTLKITKPDWEKFKEKYG